MVVNKSPEVDSDLKIESSPEMTVREERAEVKEDKNEVKEEKTQVKEEKEEKAQVNKLKITDGMCLSFFKKKSF